MAISANSSMKYMNRYSPNKLVLRKANFPNVCDDQLTALENNISSHAVAENQMHCTMPGKIFTKSESSSTWKQALRHQTRTSCNLLDIKQMT